MIIIFLQQQVTTNVLCIIIHLQQQVTTNVKLPEFSYLHLVLTDQSLSWTLQL